MQCLAGQSRSFTRVTRRDVHDYLEVIASGEYCLTDDPEQPIFKIYCIGFDCSQTIRTTIHKSQIHSYCIYTPKYIEEVNDIYIYIYIYICVCVYIVNTL